MPTARARTKFNEDRAEILHSYHPWGGVGGLGGGSKNGPAIDATGCHGLQAQDHKLDYRNSPALT